MTTLVDTQAPPNAVGRALATVPEVRVGYLFGSRARGDARPDSDLDIAVLLAPGLEEAARGRAKLAIIEALTVELGALGERADVVDLERAPSAVGFRAIRDGVCVLQRERSSRVRLEATIARRYDDDQPHRELFRKAALAAAARMTGNRG